MSCNVISSQNKVACVWLAISDVTIVWTLDPGHHRIFIPGNSYDSENITLQVPSTGLDRQFEFFIKVCFIISESN